MDKLKMQDNAEEILGINGRMISGSKGRYRDTYPDNIAIFNANVCTKDKKIWYGDIDLSTDDINKIIKLSKKINRKLYVLYETDAGFENDEVFRLDNAVFSCYKDSYKFGSTLPIKEIEGKWFYNREKVAKYDPYKDLPKHCDEKYIEESFDIQVKLPTWYYKKSPIDVIDDIVLKSLKSFSLSKKQLNSINYYITNETEELLIKKMKRYLIKVKKVDKNSYDFKKSIMWFPMYLPMVFMNSIKGPKWAKKNYIYVKFNF